MRKERSMADLSEITLNALLEKGGVKRDVATDSVKWVVDMPPCEKKKPGVLYKIKRFFTPEWKRRPYISGLVKETYIWQANNEVMVLTKPLPDVQESIAFGTLVPRSTGIVDEKRKVRLFPVTKSELEAMLPSPEEETEIIDMAATEIKATLSRS